LLKVNNFSADKVLSEAQNLHNRWPGFPTDDERKIPENVVAKIVISDNEIDITFSYLPSFDEARKYRQRFSSFIAAVLSNGKGFYNPIVYVLECHRLELKLLPPTITQPGPLFQPEDKTIRVPIRYIKGLTERTNDRLLAEHDRQPFESLADFYRRVAPSPDEMEALLRVGAFDGFGKPRTAQFWECQFFQRAFGRADAARGLLLPPPGLDRLPEVPLQEPTRRERLEWENELLGFPVSAHPLELHDHIAWDTYCPVSQLAGHVGEQVVMCGLVIEQRVHHQITGEPMKFLTLADWTGMVETELFAQTYRTYGLATVRYPVLEITAKVEPFENGRGFSLRVLRAGKPRNGSLDEQPFCSPLRPPLAIIQL
jgi:DNA polymerase III alpha subunit